MSANQHDKKTSFRIEALQDGGFVVFAGRDDFFNSDRGGYGAPVYATLKVSEALEYIRGHIRDAAEKEPA